MNRRSALALAALVPLTLGACYTTPTISRADAFAVVDLTFET
jgi:hypothetical protein